MTLPPSDFGQPYTPFEPVKPRSWFLRHKVLSVLGALALIGAVGGALSPKPAPAPAAAVSPTPTVAATSPSVTPTVARSTPTPSPTVVKPKPTVKPKPVAPVVAANWYPKDYVELSDGVAVKWAANRAGNCFMDYCAALYVLSRDGCSTLYADVNVLDSSGTIVDSGNDIASSIEAGQKALLSFNFTSSGKLKIGSVDCSAF